LILRRITGEARVTRWAAGGGRGRGAVPCKVSELLSLHVCASAVSLALALQMAYQNIKNMATIDTHSHTDTRNRESFVLTAYLRICVGARKNTSAFAGGLRNNNRIK